MEACVNPGSDLDHQRLAVGEDDRGDVPTDESFPESVRLPIDFDRSVCIDPPDEGHPAPSQRQVKAALVISIDGQRKRGRESPEVSSVADEPLAWIAGASVGDAQGPVGLVEMVVAQECLIRAPEGAEIGTGMTEHALLPEIVEALDVGIPARFAGRDEHEMDPQEQVQPHDQREAMRIPPAAGGRHLVVDLRDPRQPEPAPGLHEVLAEPVRGLLATLGGCHPPAHHGKRVNRIEAGDPLGTPEMARAHQIGLVEVTREAGPGSGIGLATTLAAAGAPLGITVPPEDSLDRAEGRQGTAPLSLQLEVDHFGPESRKARPAGPRLLQGFSDLHHAGDHTLGGASGLPLGRSAARAQAGPAFCLVPTQPLGQPGTSSPQALQDDAKSDSRSVQLDRSTPTLILISCVRRRALPGSEILGRLPQSLRPDSSRCVEGSTVLDVMKGTP